ncbi:helix-turn-helix transcriptional regulator [Cryobacterium sp. N22]|uniref:helix-turn-helix transcriptional regulator n=1 Tax=Cryobacterium sp. N22 TaxID=2048290 RepID=UPI000CE354EB|nr:helix-turn-helix transcriptional regulator [Cryobacterium sp. N22]
MTSSVALDRGRMAYAAHRYGDAFSALTDADQQGGLPAQYLEWFGTAAVLIGKPTDGIDTLTRAHEEFLIEGDVAAAARCAAWIGLHLMDLREPARSGGWFARAQRLVHEDPHPSSVQGLLLVPVALGALYGGDAESAARTFDEVAVLGERFHDPDLSALARLGQGQAQIMLGQLNAGLVLLDEVMVAVTAGEISPVPSGIIYCSVLQSCHLAFDLRRAQEWTVALDRWCNDQPELVLFSGQCQMHRAELFCLHGAWSTALEAAQVAQDRAQRGDRHALYGAYYQQGEVQRLRGEFDAAATSYSQANQTGFEPQPGLALLRLAQGKAKLAQSLIRRTVEGADPATRRRLLAAVVEIELAAGDTTAAREGADALAALGEEDAMPMLQAFADQSVGAVLLAEGEASGALNRLRQARTLWLELDTPYEAARCRVLTARAWRALGDEDAALMEFEAARATLVGLGAVPALAELDALVRETTGPDGPLTTREIEVVRLVAAGMTNKSIAGALFLSEKTVARHVSNIFAKLGLSSRAAATAYAYEHGLV